MQWGDVGRYYDAALRVLAYVEQRRPSGRRFGPDADARWAAFRGAMSASERIDLLLRDADTEWPTSFGGRTLYDISGLADDESFGPSWPSLDPVDAEEIWRRHASLSPLTSPREALLALASAWELRLELAPPAVAPTDRLLAVGPSAIASCVLAFAEGSALDWSQQVSVIATPPAHRHLAVAAAAILNAPRATLLLSSASPAPDLRGATLVASPDADAADRARADGLLRG